MSTIKIDRDDYTETTHTYDDGVIVKETWQHFEITKSLAVNVIRRGMPDEFVSLWVTSDRENFDGTTDFDYKKSAYAYFTREQALAFARAILIECA